LGLRTSSTASRRQARLKYQAGGQW